MPHDLVRLSGVAPPDFPLRGEPLEVASQLQVIRSQFQRARLSLPEETTMKQGHETTLSATLERPATALASGPHRDGGLLDVGFLTTLCLFAERGAFRVHAVSGDRTEHSSQDEESYACRTKATDVLPVTWTWLVTPLKSGDRSVRVSVQTRLVSNSVNYAGPELVPVRVGIAVEPNHAWALWSFWTSNWQYALTFVGAGGLVATFLAANRLWARFLSAVRGEHDQSAS